MVRWSPTDSIESTSFSDPDKISALKEDPSHHPFDSFRLKKVIPSKEIDVFPMEEIDASLPSFLMKEIDNILPSFPIEELDNILSSSILKLFPVEEMLFLTSTQFIPRLEETSMFVSKEIDRSLPSVPLEDIDRPLLLSTVGGN